MRGTRHHLLLALALGTLACSDDPVAVEQDPAPAGEAPSEPEPAAGEALGPQTIEREDGIVIELFERGKGPAAQAGSDLLVHYRARVVDAEEDFDSSWSRGVADRWRLSVSARPRLIEGLRRALVGLRAGARASVRIPAELGWGAAGFPAAGVGPDADLVYEVHILEVR